MEGQRSHHSGIFWSSERLTASVRRNSARSILQQRHAIKSINECESASLSIVRVFVVQPCSGQCASVPMFRSRVRIQERQLSNVSLATAVLAHTPSSCPRPAISPPRPCTTHGSRGNPRGVSKTPESLSYISVSKRRKLEKRLRHGMHVSNCYRIGKPMAHRSSPMYIL